MTSLETSGQANVTPEAVRIAQERQVVCNASRQECQSLQDEIQGSNVDGATEKTISTEAVSTATRLPNTAIQYLVQKCQSNSRLLELALTEARTLAQDDPTIFDDSDIGAMLLDDCIASAEIAAKSEQRAENASEIAAKKDVLETEKITGRELDTTIEVLKNEIAESADGKQGREQIAVAQQKMREMFADPNIALPDAVKLELNNWLSGIETTLNQMTIVVSADPVKAKALETIFASSSLDLSGTDNYSVFSEVITKVDASGQFSEDDKRRLRVEGLGIPPFRDATDMFNTLDQVAANDGRFRNADGQLVEFNEKNGVPMGRYSIHPDQTDKDGFVAKTTVGGRTLRITFDRDTEPNLVDEMVSSAMISQVLANRDFQAANRYILGGNGLAAQGVTDIKLDEFQTKRAERLYGAFMGFGTELRTGFPNQSDLREFERRLQATHIDGDAKTGDNTGRGDLSWKEIGMLEANGDINMNTVEAVGAYINRDGISLPEYSTLVNRFGNKPDELVK